MFQVNEVASGGPWGVAPSCGPMARMPRRSASLFLEPWGCAVVVVVVVGDVVCGGATVECSFVRVLWASGAEVVVVVDVVPVLCW